MIEALFKLLNASPVADESLCGVKIHLYAKYRILLNKHACLNKRTLTVDFDHISETTEPI